MVKISILTLGCIALLSGCVSSNKYVESDTMLKENASKHSMGKLSTEDFKKSAPVYKQKINEPVKNVPIITPEEYKKMIEEQNAPKNSTPEEMNQTLMEFYNEWRPVKYKFGGNSKKGIDCSAFTQRIYKEKFNINIPRTTRTQVKVGKEIKRSELETGDLVFFKTGINDRHVGVYMGNGDFMHASIKGVKFTKLDKPYYKRKYWTSRRILN